MRKFFLIILIGTFIAAIISSIVVVQMTVSHRQTKVIFLNVGQGDAILITRGKQQILIDGGPDGTVTLEEIGKYMPFWDRTIDIVIATHPDRDHIDGLNEIINHYHVQQVWHTNVVKNSSMHTHFLKQLKQKNIKTITATHGLKACFKNTQECIKVVYPYTKNRDHVADFNDTSIATIFTFGTDVFYFGGDLSSTIEDQLPITHDITVLKASHHGSRHSTSAQFLKRTQPRDVIISAGKDNKYNHPHTEVLERVAQYNAHIYRTDHDGAIVYTCITHKGCTR